MVLPITKLPNNNLRKPSTTLEREILLSNEAQDLIDNMIPTMYADDGIGLAAPQVGKNIQICIIGHKAFEENIKIIKGDIDTKKDLVLVNPTVKPTSRKKESDIEGCLSVPKTFGKVKRFKYIRIQALDRKGNEIEFEAKNFFARVIQHEVDHLNGILFIDKAKDIFREE
jgi:peptide deformylase